MRKYINVLLISISLIFSSCDNYFDPVMKGNIPADEFYQNINNLRYGLNSAFNLMQSSDYQDNELLFGESVSDNCWNSQDTQSGDVSDIVNFTYNTENPYIRQRYEVNYKGINIANQIIRSVPMIKYDSVGSTRSTNENEIRRVYAQAKVLRALFYFNLVKSYGGVSIQPENQNLDSMIVPRSSIDDTYAYIEKDLREAILILEAKRYDGTDAGQIGLGGGLGLLMKVLLYEASPGIPLQNTDKNIKWNEALEIGKYFIDGTDISVNNMVKFDERYAQTESWSQFSKRLFLPTSMSKTTVLSGITAKALHGLYDWDKIFRTIGEYSIESLIEINHYDYSGSGTSVNEGWPMNGYINNQAKEVDLYSVPTKDLYNLFQNDPRLLLTISDRNVSNFYNYDNGVQVPFNTVTAWWFSVGDYLQFTKFFVWQSEGSASNRNYRVMRYTESLLIYAEILNETGDSKRAVDIVNQVRQRARKLLTDQYNLTYRYQTILASNFKDIPYAPYDIVRDAIYKEKRIEMAGENDRWFEMAREGILSARLNGKMSVSDATGTHYKGLKFRKGVNEFLPIPQYEVLVSNGLIEQNFGY